MQFHKLSFSLCASLAIIFMGACPGFCSDFVKERSKMVENQIKGMGIKDPKVLQAMQSVPRHLFVPENSRDLAYGDHPLSIGHGQTISQPYIVAYMTELLQLKGHEKILEIGTGSGYQAAVLSHIVDTVYSIEIVCALEELARKNLTAAGYSQVITRCGDGYQGWEKQAPFDRVIITASPPSIPHPLTEQLKVGGILVSPEGKYRQKMVRLTRKKSGIHREDLIGVRFVPMTGEAQKTK